MNRKQAFLFLACIAVTSPAAAFAEETNPPAPMSVAAIKAARAFAMKALSGQCDDRQQDEATDSAFADHAYPLKWRYKYEGGSDPQHKATLYEIFCMAGAYNINTVYVMTNEDDGLSLVAFAQPQFDVEYADDDKDTYTKLKAPPRVTGYTATYFLTNADFDPKTRSLSEFAKWRGLGDAWSSGTWDFKDGKFILANYAIDPIYEANLDNPPKGLADKSFVLFPLSKVK